MLGILAHPILVGNVAITHKHGDIKQFARQLFSGRFKKRRLSLAVLSKSGRILVSPFWRVVSLFSSVRAVQVSKYLATMENPLSNNVSTCSEQKELKKRKYNELIVNELIPLNVSFDDLDPKTASRALSRDLLALYLNDLILQHGPKQNGSEYHEFFISSEGEISDSSEFLVVRNQDIF